MGVFKDLFTMWKIEYDVWLNAIMTSVKSNIIFDISSRGLLVIATNLGKTSRMIFNNNIAI